jgi:hypothetical protein
MLPPSTFINRLDKKSANEWIRKQVRSHPVKGGNIYDRFEITFVLTKNDGVVKGVRDKVTGKSKKLG